MRWPFAGARAGAPRSATAGLPPARPLAPADMLWAAGSLANLHRRPFDAALVARALVPPVTVGTLVDLLPQLGIGAQWIADRFRLAPRWRHRSSC